ncbi:hypothetical protein C2G38_2120653, partial [Gigaspora rosea]
MLFHSTYIFQKSVSTALCENTTLIHPNLGISHLIDSNFFESSFSRYHIGLGLTF